MKVVPINRKRPDERTYSFAEVAADAGITEAELIEFAKSDGLIDENGMPTQKAIDAGILTVEETGVVDIKTDGGLSLSVQTVYPTVSEGKAKTILPKQLCLSVYGEIFHEDDIIEICEPVILDRDSVIRLRAELDKFINTPF